MREIKETVEINGNKYFTRYGAAKTLAVSPITIDRYALRRMIEYYKHPTLGKLYLPESLDSFVARNTVAAKR